MVTVNSRMGVQVLHWSSSVHQRLLTLWMLMCYAKVLNFDKWADVEFDSMDVSSTAFHIYELWGLPRKWNYCRRNLSAIGCKASLTFPFQVPEEAEVGVGEDEEVYYCADILCGHLSKLKHWLIWAQIFQAAKVVKAVLIIPHSVHLRNECLAWLAMTKHLFDPVLD